MGVLSVASETATPQRRSSRVEHQPQGERLEPGDRIARFVDEFLSGLIPGNYEVSVDWSRLSPIASVISALATFVTAGGVLAWV